MANSSVQRRQADLPESHLPTRLSTLSFSATFPLSILPISSTGQRAEKSIAPSSRISSLNSQMDTSTDAPSSSTTTASTTATMPVTLPGSILSTPAASTSTTSGSALPSSAASFTWTDFPSTVGTCTSTTLTWDYVGTPETLQLLLVSDASPHTTLGTSTRKRAGNTATLATDVSTSAASWTWPQVNFTVGQYVLEAYGTDVTVASSVFMIVNGADTSCLAAKVISRTTKIATPSSEPSVTPIPSTTSIPSRKSGSVGVIAGGTVAGIVVLIVAFVAYRVVWTRRRRRQSTGSRDSTEAARGDIPSRPSIASRPQPLTSTEKNDDETDPLDSLSTNTHLTPNRRPPSFLFSDPYTSHAQARGGRAESIMDVSTIGSRTSAALSDTTSTTGLMRTFSPCPPSYATRPSRPPSYTTDKARSAAVSPSSARFSYVSSSE